MNPALKKVIRDPVGSARRAVEKLVVGPLRYRNSQGYDAQAYWGDRFARHGASLRGPGDEGLSEADNDHDYAVAQATFRAFCERNGIDFSVGRVLEIGPGTGYYTRIMNELGASSLTAIDVTDVLFDDLRTEFPSAEFRRGDVTRDPIEGTFDTAVMIDVIEHIVSDDAFRNALANVAGTLQRDGVFVVGPVLERHGRHLYYVHHWTEDDARAALPDWEVGDTIEFRTGRLLLFRRAQ